MTDINHTTVDPHWPLPSFHAVDWAHAFIETFGDRRSEIDEAVMTGWFANALMRGFDEHASRHRKELEQLQHDLSAMREELRETRVRLWNMTDADHGEEIDAFGGRSSAAAKMACSAPADLASQLEADSLHPLEPNQAR